MEPEKLVPGGMYRVTYDGPKRLSRIIGTFTEHIDSPHGKMLVLFTDRGYRRVLWSAVSRIIVMHDSKRKVS